MRSYSHLMLFLRAISFWQNEQQTDNHKIYENASPGE